MAKRRWRTRLLIVGVAAVGAWLAASYVVAHMLTHRRRPVTAEPAPAIGWGLVESLRLRTADGEELGAWYIPGRPDRPRVVLLHGNGATRRSCLRQAELLAKAGCSALLVTQRAHGDSTGDVNDFGYSARHDVVAAVEWLGQWNPKCPVVVWGQSLGSAAAAFASAELGRRVSGYVLECPYRDLRTAVRNRAEINFPPVLDTIAYASVTAVAPMVLPNFDRIAPLEAVAGIPPTTPVLILAGSADRHARPDEAQALHERLGGRSRLVVFEGASHLRLADADAAGYERAVTELLAAAAK